MLETIRAAIAAHPFPACLVFLDLCAAIFYAQEPHWGRVVYWVCAAGITSAATWGLR